MPTNVTSNQIWKMHNYNNKYKNEPENNENAIQKKIIYELIL